MTETLDEQPRKKSFKRSWTSSGPVAKLTVIFAGVAAAATLVYAGIAWYQLHVMGGQLTQMEGGSKQTDQLLSLYRQQLEELHKQAGNTHDLAVAARDEAKASKTIAEKATKQAAELHDSVEQATRLANDAEVANSTAQTALDIQTRPWIGITIDKVTIKHHQLNTHGFNAIVDSTIQNYGSSPALRVAYSFKMIPDTGSFFMRMNTRARMQRQGLTAETK